MTLTHEGEKVFVRTYRSPVNPNDWSETDFSLHAWLEHQGYKHLDGWPEGAKMRCVDHGRGTYIRAPYIDGGNNTVNHVSGDTYEIDYSGSHNCCNTSGITDKNGNDGSEDDDTFHCEDCDENYSIDEQHAVGRNEDRYVCEGCRESYTWVRGASRRGGGYFEYYAHEDNAAYVESGDFHVDTNNVPDDVVCTENGCYALREDCIEINGDYYFDDDPDVVCFAQPDGDEYYGLKDDSYEDADGKWWASHEHYLEHNDDPEDDEDEDDNSPNPVVEDLTETEETEVA
jgi:hypothetical protein